MKIAIELIILHGVGPFGTDMKFTALNYGTVHGKMEEWVKTHWKELWKGRTLSTPAIPYEYPVGGFRSGQLLTLLRAHDIRITSEYVLYDGPGKYTDANPDLHCFTAAMKPDTDSTVGEGPVRDNLESAERVIVERATKPPEEKEATSADALNPFRMLQPSKERDEGSPDSYGSPAAGPPVKLDIKARADTLAAPAISHILKCPLGYSMEREEGGKLAVSYSIGEFRLRASRAGTDSTCPMVVTLFGNKGVQLGYAVADSPGEAAAGIFRAYDGFGDNEKPLATGLALWCWLVNEEGVR